MFHNAVWLQLIRAPVAQRPTGRRARGGSTDGTCSANSRKGSDMLKRAFLLQQAEIKIKLTLIKTKKEEGAQNNILMKANLQTLPTLQSTPMKPS